MDFSSLSRLPDWQGFSCASKEVALSGVKVAVGWASMGFSRRSRFMDGIPCRRHAGRSRSLVRGELDPAVDTWRLASR